MMKLKVALYQILNMEITNIMKNKKTDIWKGKRENIMNF